LNGTDISGAAPAFDNTSLAADLGAAFPDVLSAMLAGVPVTSVRIVGVTASEAIGYDLKLGNVVFSGLGGSTSDPEFAGLSYGQISLVPRIVAADGSVGPDQLFEFDVTDNRPTASIPDPVTGQGASPVTDLTYFLTVEGVQGSFDGNLTPATSIDAVGTFQLSDFGFFLSSFGSPPTFSNREVSAAFDLGTAIAALADLAGDQTLLPSVMIEGFTQTGDLAYRLKLGDVTVRLAVDDTLRDGGASFAYTLVSLERWGRDDTGQLIPSNVVSYDFDTDQTAVTIPDPTPGTGALQTGDAVEYYLIVDGLPGIGESPDVPQGYKIEVSDFGIFTDGFPPILAKVPINVNAILGQHWVDFADLLAGGSILPSVQVVGLDASSGTIYDLRAANAILETVFNGSGDISFLGFDDTEIALPTLAPDDPGQPGVEPARGGQRELFRRGGRECRSLWGRILSIGHQRALLDFMSRTRVALRGSAVKCLERPTGLRGCLRDRHRHVERRGARFACRSRSPQVGKPERRGNAQPPGVRRFFPIASSTGVFTDRRENALLIRNCPACLAALVAEFNIQPRRISAIN